MAAECDVIFYTSTVVEDHVKFYIPYLFYSQITETSSRTQKVLSRTHMGLY